MYTKTISDEQQKLINIKKCLVCFGKHLDGGFNKGFYPFMTDIRRCASCKDSGLCDDLKHLVEKWMNGG